MTMIITRAQAAAHLRIDDATDEAADLDLKIQAASAVVLDYIEWTPDRYVAVNEINELDSDYEIDSDWDEDWDSDWLGDEDSIFQIKAAVLLLVGDMHRYRDAGSPNYSEATLPPPVRALLYPIKSWGTY